MMARRAWVIPDDALHVRTADVWVWCLLNRPAASNVAENVAIFDAIRQAAQARGGEVFSREMADAEDLAPAFDYAKGSGAQALIFLTDNLMFGRRKEIAALALSHQLLCT
jgi:hypothetical protein